MNAAERDYQLDDSISLAINTEVGKDDRVHLMPGDSIDFDLVGYVDTVQWRSNHLRDDWANLHSFDHGDSQAAIDLTTIVHQLEHLPGIEVEGNHTLSVRGLVANESGGHSSSSIVSVNVMLMDTANAKSFGEDDGMLSGISEWFVPATAFFLLLLVFLGVFILNRSEDATTVEKIFWADADIEAVADDAELDV